MTGFILVDLPLHKMIDVLSTALGLGQTLISRSTCEFQMDTAYLALNPIIIRHFLDDFVQCMNPEEVNYLTLLLLLVCKRDTC